MQAAPAALALILLWLALTLASVARFLDPAPWWIIAPLGLVGLLLNTAQALDEAVSQAPPVDPESTDIDPLTYL